MRIALESSREHQEGEGVFIDENGEIDETCL